jgi:hypothetical protein
MPLKLRTSPSSIPANSPASVPTIGAVEAYLGTANRIAPADTDNSTANALTTGTLLTRMALKE